MTARKTTTTTPLHDTYRQISSLVEFAGLPLSPAFRNSHKASDLSPARHVPEGVLQTGLDPNGPDPSNRPHDAVWNKPKPF